MEAEFAKMQLLALKMERSNEPGNAGNLQKLE